MMKNQKKGPPWVRTRVLKHNQKLPYHCAIEVCSLDLERSFILKPKRYQKKHKMRAPKKHFTASSRNKKAAKTTDNISISPHSLLGHSSSLLPPPPPPFLQPQPRPPEDNRRRRAGSLPTSSVVADIPQSLLTHSATRPLFPPPAPPFLQTLAAPPEDNRRRRPASTPLWICFPVVLGSPHQVFFPSDDHRRREPVLQLQWWKRGVKVGRDLLNKKKVSFPVGCFQFVMYQPGNGLGQDRVLHFGFSVGPGQFGGKWIERSCGLGWVGLGQQLSWISFDRSGSEQFRYA